MGIERSMERRVLSVLFADLVGFTSLSEQLDAEDVTLVQDAYFDAVRETVTRHGGQLEKFVGDAAMSVFGAPRVRDDDAERAVRAALALVAGVQRVGAGLGLEPGTLRVRVGVATGETVYGEASAERGPVTGDVVNVAARLQAAGEPETVTIGEATALAVAEAIELERLPPFELKGKAEPVPAWRAVGVHAERSRERALGRLRAPTLGRGDELRRLGALVGSTARVTVIAPPGVGKTRLPDERPQWLEGGERLDLPLLPSRETEELVRELVGEALPAELVERVAERSAGNPLFVEELLRTWAGVGILVADEAGWRLAAPAEEVELPLTVQAIYAAQLDDLPPPARAAARRAAVAGRRFPGEALAVLEVEEPEAALETLVRRALVSGSEEDVLLGPSHSYRHALLRDAGYASLARAERARLHVRLADWLAERHEQSRPALAEVIARHYAAALADAPTLARDIGGLERDTLQARAGDWFETAARVALGFAAWASARDLAARALDLSEEAVVERARRLH